MALTFSRSSSLVLAACLLASAAWAEAAADKKTSGRKPPAAPAAAEPAKRPLTLADIWAVERIGNPVVSPDGAWVAYTLTSYEREKNAGVPQIWLASIAGDQAPRRLTYHEAGARNPVFSPDGQWLVFSSKRDDKPAQLHRLPLRGGESEPLTSLPISPGTPKFTPDGSTLIFTASTWPDLNDDWVKVKAKLDAQSADKVQAKISDRRQLRYWDSYKTDGTTPHLFSLDLASRVVKDLTPNQYFVGGFESLEWDLAPDGKEAAIAVHTGEASLRRLDYDIRVIDLATGESRGLAGKGPSNDAGPRYSPDGKYLLYGKAMRPEWPSERSRLIRFDRKTGQELELLADWDREAGNWQVDPSGAWVVFVAEDRAQRHLYKVSIDGGPPEKLASGGSIGSPQITSGGQVVYSRDAYYEPADLYAVALAGGTPARLTRQHETLMSGIARGKVENVTYAGAEGAEVQMWVLYPPDFDPAKKWPLMMMLHGGPHGASMDGFSYRWSAELFAAHGYVVGVPNFHGSTGFGQAFADAIVGRHGDKPFADVMAGVDLLVGRKYIDETRMAAAGGSYGGYLVTWILGHTDRFAALINHAGVYDLNAQFASDATWGRPASYGAEPWEDPVRIDEQSPSRFAKNFKTPTLILHGEIDYRVPVTQGILLHGVLTGKGVPSRIVIFPSENHWIMKQQSAELWWSEVFGWLDKYMGPPAG